MQKQKLTATQGLFYTRLSAYYQTTGSLPSIREFIKHLKDEYGLIRGITAVGDMLNSLRDRGWITNKRPTTMHIVSEGTSFGSTKYLLSCNNNTLFPGTWYRACWDHPLVEYAYFDTQPPEEWEGAIEWDGDVELMFEAEDDEQAILVGGRIIDTLLIAFDVMHWSISRFNITTLMTEEDLE